MNWTWADDGIRTELRGEPWGEDGTIPVTVRLSGSGSAGEPPTAEEMSDAQRKTYELLRDYGPDVYPLVIEALEERFGRADAGGYEAPEDEAYDAYEDQLYGGYDEQPGDGAPISDLFDSYENQGAAVEHDEEAFEDQFSIQEIFIFDTEGPTAEWALTGHADFEPEHGIGLIFDYNEVDEVGYQEIVLARLR